MLPFYHQHYACVCTAAVSSLTDLLMSFRNFW